MCSRANKLRFAWYESLDMSDAMRYQAHRRTCKKCKAEIDRMNEIAKRWKPRNDLDEELEKWYNERINA